MGNYIWVFLEKFSLIVIKLIFMAVAARWISPEVFGIFAIAIFLVNSLGLVVDSGMAGSIIKEKVVDELDYYTLNYFNVVVAIIISVVLIGFSGLVANYYQKPELSTVLSVLSLILIFRAFSTVYFTYLCRELRFAEQTKITFLATIISVALTLILIWQGLTLWALVFQQVIESLLVFLLLIYITKINFFKFIFSKEKFRKHFVFGTRLSLSSLIESSFPNLILNKVNAIGGINAVGSYSQNVKVSDLFIGIMTMTLDKVMMPVMAKSINNKSELSGYINQILMYFSAIAYFFICILIVCAHEIVFILLGKQWLDSSWILSLIAYCGFAQIIEMVCRSILKSQGFSANILYVSILKLIALMIALFLYPPSGIEYILITLTILSWVNVLFYLIMIKDKVGINIYSFLKKMFPAFLASVVAITSVKLIFSTNDNSTYLMNLINLIGKSTLVFVLYTIVLVILGFPLKKSIKALISK